MTSTISPRCSNQAKCSASFSVLPLSPAGCCSLLGAATRQPTSAATRNLAKPNPVGLLYGAMVFAVSTWIGLPIAAGIFDSGDQITNMAEMAGWARS